MAKSPMRSQRRRLQPATPAHGASIHTILAASAISIFCRHDSWPNCSVAAAPRPLHFPTVYRTRGRHTAAFVSSPFIRALSTRKNNVNLPINPIVQLNDNNGHDPATNDNNVEIEEVDVAIVGAGIGGLCAGAILNTLYGKKVGVYESHYLAGGCAHAFERSVKLDTNNDGMPKTTTFTFDSGPTIVLGCSKEPYNPLQQVLRAVGVDSMVEWIPYDGWGMIEHPESSSQSLHNNMLKTETKRWKLQVGPGYFEEGPLQTFSPNSKKALDEFNTLRELTSPLVEGAANIPAMAMRPGNAALVPLLRYLTPLFKIISNGVEASTGPFAPYSKFYLLLAADPFAFAVWH